MPHIVCRREPKPSVQDPVLCRDLVSNPNDFDPETVLVHEFGHVLGLLHSQDISAVMAAIYDGVSRVRSQDDEEGVTYIYDANVNGVLSGIVSDQDGNPIHKAKVELEGTGLSDRTNKKGEYTISCVPDPVT